MILIAVLEIIQTARVNQDNNDLLTNVADKLIGVVNKLDSKPDTSDYLQARYTNAPDKVRKLVDFAFSASEGVVEWTAWEKDDELRDALMNLLGVTLEPGSGPQPGSTIQE